MRNCGWQRSAPRLWRRCRAARLAYSSQQEWGHPSCKQERYLRVSIVRHVEQFHKEGAILNSCFLRKRERAILSGPRALLGSKQSGPSVTSPTESWMEASFLAKSGNWKLVECIVLAGLNTEWKDLFNKFALSRLSVSNLCPSIKKIGAHLLYAQDLTYDQTRLGFSEIDAFISSE